MTLHWWQHWFWITRLEGLPIQVGRAPVTLLLVSACCHALGQQAQSPWGAFGEAGPPGPQHWLLPVAVHVPVPVAVEPWSPWGPRRLLGFAGPGLGDDAAPRQPEAAAPATATYVTTFGPGSSGTTLTSQPSRAMPSASASAPRAREPKIIGVLPSTAGTPTTHGPASSALSQAATTTNIAEIVEVLTAPAIPAAAAAAAGENATWPSPASASSSPPPSTSTTTEAGMAEDEAFSAEMPNDEPAQASSASSASTETSSASSALPEQSEPSASKASISVTSSRGQSVALATAPTASTVNGISSTTGVADAANATLVLDLGVNLGPALHPGVSTPRRPTSPGPPGHPGLGTGSAVTMTTAPEVPSSSSPERTTETPSGHRSAASVSTSAAGRQKPPAHQGSHQGPHQGPGAMSLSSGGGLDAGSITGIVLGIVVFAGLVGTVSFVLYRRRYLNKPQTLNDKCSNPDSSGYIDDSTFRENSEEMYSLDNDSFLNSLEAMTIQNYWTDTVKHTKL